MWVRRHVRYVIEKPNKNGTARFYWQRRGFPTRRLRRRDLVPGGLADRLNASADRGDPPGPDYGTISWGVDLYKKSPKFTRLAASTRRIYERWMIALTKQAGADPITDLTPQACYEIVDGIESKGGKVHCAAVLSKVAKVGMKHGLLATNPASALELEGSNRRDEIWEPWEQEAFLSASESIPDGIGYRRGFLMLKYTAQRPGDMRRAAWPHYNGQSIMVRQQKTGKLLEIACHAVLRAELDQADRISTVIVTRDDGRPFTEAQWIAGFKEIMARAGIEGKQARDLRRTAMVELAVIETPLANIASVSGHSIDRTTKILETYIPRNAALARTAIRRWEERS